MLKYSGEQEKMYLTITHGKASVLVISVRLYLKRVTSENMYRHHCYGPGSFRPWVVSAWVVSANFLGVGRFGFGMGVVSALSHFGPISIW